MNKIRFNSVILNIQRLKFWKSAQEFKFIDVKEGSDFWGLPFEYQDYASFDGGLTYHDEEGHLLFRLKYSMSDEMVRHTYTAQNIMDMTSDFGGLLGVVLVVFDLLAKFINEKVIKAKFIRSLFFVKKPAILIPKFKVNIGESYLHKKLSSFSIVKVRFYNCFRSRANSDQIKELDQQKLFQQGEEQVDNELCLINILQTLQKLRAATAIII
jgi:hypothetical protein